jgi:hypothetical protein
LRFSGLSISVGGLRLALSPEGELVSSLDM